MYWRRFKVSDIPVSNPKAFEIWLTARWLEKDELIEHFHTHGRFPADDGANADPNDSSKMVRGAGLIETQVKAAKWHDFMQVFAPMDALSLIPDSLHGALPKLSASIVERVNGYRNGAAQTSKKQVAFPPKSAVAAKSAVATQSAVIPRSTVTPKSAVAKQPTMNTRIAMANKVAAPGAVLPRSATAKLVPKKTVPANAMAPTASKTAAKTAALAMRTMSSPMPPPYKMPVANTSSATKSAVAKPKAQSGLSGPAKGPRRSVA